LAKNDPNFSFSVSAVEIYLQDGYDLLNKKAKVNISGTRTCRGKGANMLSSVMEAKFDANGKWISPYQNGNFEAPEEFEAKGVFEKPVLSIQDIIDVMQIVETTRTAKSHNLNDRSSRSHCIVTLICTKTSGKLVQTSKF
jgi:hypothetical protein